jgi:hypothetical protein
MCLGLDRQIQLPDDLRSRKQQQQIVLDIGLQPAKNDLPEPKFDGRMKITRIIYQQPGRNTARLVSADCDRLAAVHGFCEFQHTDDGLVRFHVECAVPYDIDIDGALGGNVAGDEHPTIQIGREAADPFGMVGQIDGDRGNAAASWKAAVPETFKVKSCDGDDETPPMSSVSPCRSLP